MKRFLCYALTAILLISMAGCSSDADLVGTWEQEMEISVLGAESTASVMSVVRFTFQEDGTGVQEQIIPDGSHPDAVLEFTYAREKQTLTLDYGDNQTETFSVSLQKNVLKLENRRGRYDLTRIE